MSIEYMYVKESDVPAKVKEIAEKSFKDENVKIWPSLTNRTWVIISDEYYMEVARK